MLIVTGSRLHANQRPQDARRVDRYNIVSERDLADAAKKLEISYSLVTVAETQQETQHTEPVTIQ